MLILVFESIVCEFCRRIVSQMRDLPGHARGYGNTRSFLSHPKTELPIPVCMRKRNKPERNKITKIVRQNENGNEVS